MTIKTVTNNPLEEFNYEYYVALYDNNKWEAKKYIENPKQYIRDLNNNSINNVKSIKWNK